MPIRIGTGERGGTFYTQGLALKAALERIPHAPDIEVLESSAGVSIENANRLEAGEIDFGFISAPWVVAAKQGTAPFTDERATQACHFVIMGKPLAAD